MDTSTVVSRLEPGDHLCWTFDDDLARDEAWAAYVAGGARLGHRVLSLGDDPVPDRARALLARAGIDVDRLLASGQLRTLSVEDGYLTGAAFDPDAAAARWYQACAEARRDGFEALRAVGDMSWAARTVPGTDQLADYEAQVNLMFAAGYAIGLCLYDRRCFEPAALSGIVSAHPATAGPEPELDPGLGGAPGTWPDEPLLRLRWLDGGAGLRLTGGIDLSNAAALGAVLDALEPAGPGEPARVLDLTGVRFLDVAGARAVVRTARRLGGMRVLVDAPIVIRLLTLVGAGRVRGLDLG